MALKTLRDGQVEVVEPRGIEQHVILHRRAAEAGVVGDAGDAAVGALDDPVFESVEFHRRAIGAVDDVAIDEAAGAEQRRHAWRDAAGKLSVGDALEDDVAREVGVGAFVEREDDVGKTVERDGAHHAQVRRAVHREFERQSGEALDFFGGVAGPLRDQLDHRWRKVGIGVDRHALEGDRAGDDDQQREHQHDEALLAARIGRCDGSSGFAFSRRLRLVLQRILELQEQAAVADDVLAFF